MSNLLRGTMLLTGASFLSKFLGMVYVIPFTNIVEEEGMTLYSYAYTPYSIILSISTVGVPLAVSKFVSKYNALDDYHTSMRMFKWGLSLMAITGFLAFLVLFFGAETIARFTIDPRTEDITIDDVKHVIQMVSVALIIIPAMSIVRGFFQGHQSMGPTAVSQVVEQIVRILFLLISVFIIMVLLNGDVTVAIGYATFAAFIGGLASFTVLYWYWQKRKAYIKDNVIKQKKKSNIPKVHLFQELFRYAGPFVLVGIATPLYQLVDQFTFSRAMAEIGQEDISSIAYSSFNLQGHKLVIIPVTIATGLSLALLPEITKAFNLNQMTRVKNQINQALQIIMFFVLPSVFGLMILSDEIYGSLFGYRTIEISGPLFAWYTPVALCFAFFTVTSSILQGIEQQRFTVISLTVGLLIKILCNALMIQMIGGAKGAILTTIVASGAAVFLNLWQIKKTIGFPYRKFMKLTALMGIFTAIMSIILLLLKWLLGIILNFDDNRLIAFIVVMITVTIGGIIYLYLSYVSTLLERVIGKKIRPLDKLFGR
ncbi:polysaccharide biosynthesis protein [Gracilibacillus sp. YIM 98692]|uniref:putative polysaccharide biosynthesis protein n=1 Tax=Gracilibacillus sp. YIM 98692 TaxID=2663532 RepID=UPI0013D60E6F|nr:polysaccharide biosynthesis protein [Gracilibacillus sp. YIM 98692]